MMTDAETAAAHGPLLGKVAADALRHGLVHNTAPVIAPAAFPEALRAPRATFVTLEERGELRGCIGSLVPRQSLVEDVAANAYGAGFKDPRFPRLTPETLGRLTVGISILGPFETLHPTSEEELFRQAAVGIDGFVISADGHRALFLPQVWEVLPTPQAFFEALREKAGLPRRYWSPGQHIERFRVTAVPKRAVAELASAAEFPPETSLRPYDQ